MNPPLRKFVNDLANASLSDIADREFVYTRPSVNIVEGETAFEIQVAAPGLQKDAFAIQLQEGVLTITADAPRPEGKFTRREFDYTQFKRSFKVGDQIDGDKVTALYEQGILIVRLPKRDPEELRTRISVK